MPEWLWNLLGFLGLVRHRPKEEERAGAARGGNRWDDDDGDEEDNGDRG